jgi:ribose 5-phosphate isomerase RpiB
MTIRRFVVPAVVIADGSGTFYTPYFSGFVESVQYTKTDYADTVDFAITADVTGEGIWTEANVTASAIRHPRAATCTNAGVASLYAGSGTAVNDKIALGRDRVKFAITNGGTSTTGSFTVTVTD